MELSVVPIFAFLMLEVVVSHAALPSEVYWDTMLPNTPMPKAIQDLLRPDFEEEKISTTVIEKKMHIYDRAASEEDLRDDPNVSLFFLEKDLHIGTNMNLYFTKTTTKATLLPHQVAETIPFSSKKLPEIFHQLSLKPQSKEANLIKETIKECEKPAKAGQAKYCTTSLVSMIDFSTSKLGKNVQVMSTEMDNKWEKKNKQQYYTISGVEKMVGNNFVVCHGMTYAYAVFFCHAPHNTRAYVVPLVGADGTKVKAVAACHTDTSAWNPKHAAFQVLKVIPGTVPICHFLSEDILLWAQN